MSEDGFVDRPPAFPYQDKNRIQKLIQTATNGRAILMKATTAGGGYRAALWEYGYRLHLSTRGAPKGMVIAWATGPEHEATDRAMLTGAPKEPD